MKRTLTILALLVVIVVTFSFAIMKGTGVKNLSLNNIGLSFLGISTVATDEEGATSNSNIDVPSSGGIRSICGPGSTCGNPGGACTTPQGQGMCTSSGSNDPCVCVVPPVRHFECVGYSCQSVLGPGPNTCSVASSTVCTASTTPYTNSVSAPAAPLACTWQWGPELRLTNDTNSSWTPSIVLDSFGDASILWVDDNGGSRLYYTKINPDGNVLISRTQVVGQNLYGIKDLNVVIDSQNNIHAVWKVRVQFNESIYYAKFDSYGTVLIPERLIIGPIVVPQGYSYIHDLSFDNQNSLYVLYGHYVSYGQSTNHVLKLDLNGNVLSTLPSIYSMIADRRGSMLSSSFLDLAFSGSGYSFNYQRFDILGNSQTPVIPIWSYSLQSPTPVILKDSQSNIHFLSCMSQVPYNRGIRYAKINPSSLSLPVTSSFLPLSNNCELYDTQDAAINSQDQIQMVYVDSRAGGEIYYKEIDRFGTVVSESKVSNGYVPGNNLLGGRFPSISLNDESTFVVWEDYRHASWGGNMNTEIYGRIYSCI